MGIPDFGISYIGKLVNGLETVSFPAANEFVLSFGSIETKTESCQIRCILEKQ
jgi:hypothetical protein